MQSPLVFQSIWWGIDFEIKVWGVHFALRRRTPYCWHLNAPSNYIPPRWFDHYRLLPNGTLGSNCRITARLWVCTEQMLKSQLPDRRPNQTMNFEQGRKILRYWHRIWILQDTTGYKVLNSSKQNLTKSCPKLKQKMLIKMLFTVFENI